VEIGLYVCVYKRYVAINVTAQLTTSREERGQAIAQLNGQVKRVDDCTYTVKSQSHDGEYTVHKVGEEWVCSCPDNTTDT